MAVPVIVREWDSSAASLARARYERTGERTSPYLAHPERESYRQFRELRLGDVTYVEYRECHRWAGVHAEPGPWRRLGVE